MGGPLLVAWIQTDQVKQLCGLCLSLCLLCWDLNCLLRLVWHICLCICFMGLLGQRWKLFAVEYKTFNILFKKIQDLISHRAQSGTKHSFVDSFKWMPSAHIVKVVLVPIWTPMGMLVWEWGVFWCIIGALPYWGSRKRLLLIDQGKSWSKVSGVVRGHSF